MILICINYCSFWNALINVLSIFLLAIGAFCVLVFVIWKITCCIDYCRCCKKRHQKEDIATGYVLKDFSEAMTILNQTINKINNKPELSWKKHLALKGELKLIREKTEMCFIPEKIEKVIEDKVAVNIAVYFHDINSQLCDFVSTNTKEKLPKNEDMLQSCISLLREYEELAKDIDGLENADKEKKIKEWLSKEKTITLKKQLNEYITNIDNCIEDGNNDDNEQTQQ